VNELALEPLAGGDPAEVAGYRLRGRLGAGGMGRVYLAFTPGGRPVALKVVRPELGEDPDFRARFRQEIAAARQVSGLFTAQVLDGDPDGTPPWLVTAYVAGPSLAQAVADHGPVPAASVFLLMAGVAEALAAIHAAGVVHRDLKPSNVLLAADGPRVIDFGIARAAEATAVTRSGMRVGSPQFMAPEQVRGDEVGPAADVWALGALAAFAATGRTPFGEGSEAAVLYRVLQEDPDLDGCPPPLRAVIGRCLAKDPAARPSPAQVIESCRDQAAGKTVEFTGSWLPPALAADLTRHAAPDPDPARDTAPAPSPRQRMSRRTLIAVTAAAALLVALAGYGVAALATGGRHGQHPAVAGSPGPSRGSSHRTRPKTVDSPSPSPSSTLDSCLFGTWKETSEDDPAMFNSTSVVWVGGPGITQIFRPDGVNIIEDHGARFITHQGGNTWTNIVTGRGSVHYVTHNGVLLSSNLSVSGRWELLENGSYNNSGPMTIGMDPDSYFCSGNTLRLYDASGMSIVMTREVPPAPGS